jgi:hypothetical protein
VEADVFLPALMARENAKKEKRERERERESQRETMRENNGAKCIAIRAQRSTECDARVKLVRGIRNALGGRREAGSEREPRVTCL